MKTANGVKQFKIIFSGSLDFGNRSTFEKVVNACQKRVEVYYKNDLLIKWEAAFNEDCFRFDIPKQIFLGVDKSWKNTVDFLQFINQFALAGKVEGWLIDERELVSTIRIEPDNDKAVVRDFQRGSRLSQEGKDVQEALEALNKAIEKYESHALAYERRGYVNYLLKNYQDCSYDFTKSLTLNPFLPDPYLGRAMVYVRTGKVAEAGQDLSKALELSVPHQPLYWTARRLHAEYLAMVHDLPGALRDYKLFVNRKFKETDPNYTSVKSARYKYARLLDENGDYMEAFQELGKALELDYPCEQVNDETLLEYRMILAEKLGISLPGNDPAYPSESKSRTAAVFGI